MAGVGVVAHSVPIATFLESSSRSTSTSTARSPQRILTRGLVLLLGLGVLGFALYAPMVDDYFIADDFVNLGFVRNYEGAWLDFFHPTRSFSDPVTGSRYKPLYTLYVAAIDRLFGDHAAAHHLLSIALHAGVAAAVYALSRRLFASRAIAAAAAALFLSSRLHSQTVMWVSASYRLLSTLLALLCLVLFLGRVSLVRQLLQVALFAAALLMNPDLTVVLPVLFLLAWQRRRASPLPWLTLGLCTLVLGAFAYANYLSTRVFPDSAALGMPQLDRAATMLVQLFVPFQLPWPLKVMITLAFVVGALVPVRRDPRAALLLACMLPSALLWSTFTGYELAPRYLYFSGTFAAILQAVALVWCARALSERWAPDAQRRPLARLLGALLVLGSVLAHGWVLREHDLVLYEYRALLGGKLAALHTEARATGERMQVYVQPESHLSPSDLAFFAPELRFVDTETHTPRVVSTEGERYRERLGPELESSYWYLPWFR
jgi:hypothetical protein